MDYKPGTSIVSFRRGSKTVHSPLLPQGVLDRPFEFIAVCVYVCTRRTCAMMRIEDSLPRLRSFRLYVYDRSLPLDEMVRSHGAARRRPELLRRRINGAAKLRDADLFGG